MTAAGLSQHGLWSSIKMLSVFEHGLAARQNGGLVRHRIGARNAKQVELYVDVLLLDLGVRIQQLHQFW